MYLCKIQGSREAPKTFSRSFRSLGTRVLLYLAQQFCHSLTPPYLIPVNQKMNFKRELTFQTIHRSEFLLLHKDGSKLHSTHTEIEFHL